MLDLQIKPVGVVAMCTLLLYPRNVEGRVSRGIMGHRCGWVLYYSCYAEEDIPCLLLNRFALNVTYHSPPVATACCWLVLVVVLGALLPCLSRRIRVVTKLNSADTGLESDALLISVIVITNAKWRKCILHSFFSF